MRILSVRQPWADAIVFGGKDIENRVNNVAGDYRGDVAIQAALTAASFDEKHPDLWPLDDLVTGAIIGVVELVKVHRSIRCKGECSTWADDSEYHLELARPRPLVEPIPFKGALGLRRLPTRTETEITARVGVRA